jgi:acyl CoA:acetate/3-ketoacid CoA transferase alpha subunit/acyl CoA:acetate/3-ketoacid CoA transferase beta subunit
VEEKVDNKWDDFLDKTFTLKEYEGKNKVLDLSEAIKRNVKPGMNLYLGERSNALICELIRQFHGSHPDFTIVMLFVMEQALNLVHCGLVKNIVTTSCTEFFPTSGPSGVIRNAFKNRAIGIENWSLCTLNQRLLGGALDLQFTPTKSIANSSMAQENKDSFCQIPDPFGGERPVNLMKTLKPDVALVHGWAADPAGNTIVAPCAISGEYNHGAKASKNGVIVTVEQIVSTEFIREHSALVSIPAGIVNSVSLAPLGAHPQGMVTDYGVAQFQPYAEDYEFTKGRRGASRDPQSLDSWIKDWVLDSPTHDAYLDKLGSDKVSFLKEKGTKRDWRDNLDTHEISYSPEYNSREMMVIAAARKTKELVLKNNYDGVLCGIGTSGLPGWVAYYVLRKEDYDVNLWIGSGIYGFSPCPGDPQLCSLPTIMSARMLTNGLNAYGIFIGGNHKGKYMSILSAAQIDQHGNLNSTKLSDTSYVIGSGGGNDATNANEVLVVIPQAANRFVPEVSYITCPGNNTTVIVSDMGIFERIDGKFVLTTFFPDPKIPNSNDIVTQIRENCSWELMASPQLRQEPAPSLEELVTLRAFDPQGYFIGGD